MHLTFQAMLFVGHCLTVQRCNVQGVYA
uniref:Uncharacterized protein n=1 Tax=Arundo donax TaxID=35708 RepID=A0A0A9FDT5_ARUDO